MPFEVAPSVVCCRSALIAKSMRLDFPPQIMGVKLRRATLKVNDLPHEPRINQASSAQDSPSPAIPSGTGIPHGGVCSMGTQDAPGSGANPDRLARHVHNLRLEGIAAAQTAYRKSGSGRQKRIRTGESISGASWRMLPASEPTLAASPTKVVPAPVLNCEPLRQRWCLALLPPSFNRVSSDARDDPFL